VQQEAATSLDPELMGPIAAIGIVKGKPFAPDARMKKIMTEALAVANATSRSLFMSPRKFVPQNNLVDVHMGWLRRKVDMSGEQLMIHSIRGNGFIFRAPA
jgi:hypothetical protein